MNQLQRFKNWFSKLSLAAKIFSLLILAGASYLLYSRFKSGTAARPQYQTASVEKGTLVDTVTASGTISSTSSTSVTTSASGVVSKVYAKNGDTVTQGQRLADVQLDQDASQKQASGWSSYLNAVNSRNSAQQNKLSLQAQLESARKSVLDAQNAVDAMNNNLANGSNNPATRQAYTDLEKLSIQSALTNARENFTATERKYNDADSAISSSQAQVNSAWLAYQQTASSITAPVSGVLADFALVPGVSISSSSNSGTGNNNSNNLQKVGSVVKPQGSIQAVVNLTEIDVPKVNPGQKVTLTLDAFPGKTFTGKVIAINTDGQVSSGVTSYPTAIMLDSDTPNIYPNMSANAKIITSVKNDVLMVPSAAVQIQNGSSFVRILKNGQLAEVPVTTGISNDSQTEIASGLNEGDSVITGVVNSSTGRTGQSSGSPFSGFGGNRGGGAFRLNGR